MDPMFIVLNDVPMLTPLNIPFRKGHTGFPNSIKFLMNHTEEIVRGNIVTIARFL